VELYDRFEKGIFTKERKNIFFVQRRERKSKRVYLEIDEEGVYLTIKVTTDCTGIFCKKRKMKRRGWYKTINILMSE